MAPVIAAHGHTYERTATQHWLQGSCHSPVTGDKLPHTRLMANVLVKSALATCACVFHRCPQTVLHSRNSLRIMTLVTTDFRHRP